MEIEKGVKGSDSPSGDEEKELDPSHQGDGDASNKGSEKERPIENYKAELRRKDELLKEKMAELEELKQEREQELEEKKERMEELQDKEKLTASEKNELESLEAAVAAIKADPKSRAWQKLTAEIADKRTDAQIMKLDYELAQDYIEEVADREKIPVEKLEKEIVRYMRKVDPGATMKLHRRARAAFKLMQEDKAYAEKLAVLKEKEKQFAETKETAPRPMGRKEVFDNAKTSDKGMMELLKTIHVGQSEELNKAHGK